MQTFLIALAEIRKVCMVRHFERVPAGRSRVQWTGGRESAILYEIHACSPLRRLPPRVRILTLTYSTENSACPGDFLPKFTAGTAFEPAGLMTVAAGGS